MRGQRHADVVGPVVGLAALGLYLLTATQPWATAVVEPALGAPRSSLEIVPGDVVAWGPAAALVAALAGVVSWTVRTRWGRWLLLTGVLGAVTAAAAAIRVLMDPATTVAGDVVTVAPTTWAGVAAGAGALACAALSRSLLLPTASRDRRPPTPDTSPGSAADTARRSAAQQWQDLTEGRDPTSGA
ncbi:Trp biosynthesis-associated membrane protein [Ornithinimicrobium tianjinense]|uniref:Tryptophan-associated transmembrane protein (Trp_oprn_chp) n=1 Tax=Ornithinimicrobium tianjinense TaxID=1195761 RepID=A0A917BJX6_9MICO|nr:Trp biosynthesis-associated membrane protein [Ornithinimicrobium tianjinense]GGF48299.1 hypothetical protein GCM10011366_15120 [Ornithinimicrobium tianjinense]